MLQNARAFSSFSVRDMEEAIRFYRDQLQLAVEQTYMGVALLKLNPEMEVMLYPKENHQPAQFTVLNFYVADLEATVDRLSESGVEFEQYDMGEIKTDERGIARNEHGPDMAWCADPSGNIIGLIQQSEKEH